MDLYGFYTGNVFNAYEHLGAHKTATGWRFRVFAPNAVSISVIGDFNEWQEDEMHRTYDGNFWEVDVPNASAGDMYKYRIYAKNGGCVDHCDPYGYAMELRPNNASVLVDMNKFAFDDGRWMKKRTDCKNKPLNIYEIHMGSWKRKSDEPQAWLSYDEVADRLIPYLKEMGYNYVEVMPLSEHPCDESWGYQCTGFYSVTSRYGSPDQLKYFINECHKNNIGVILDFVPVHFAVDGYALHNFDGAPLYEYPEKDIRYSQWGSCNFNHSRGDVRSFLQSNANFWLSEYHFDGIRIDAVSNLIYWMGNSDRGENINSIRFLKHMNRNLKAMHPGIILAAEDSSAYPDITKPVEDGGLGFDYKWDMGWMNDTLEYFRTAPQYRSRDYHKLTFSMQYFYSEQFLLPFSHDEVVHGKATIMQKMSGEYEYKFPQARALYMYMYTHPGKKLSFMGNENGQLREWDESREQDTNILLYPLHSGFKKYIAALNKLYLESPALYERDYDGGFEWINCHCEEYCMYVYKRFSKQQTMICLFNLSDKDQAYILYEPNIEKAELVLSTEDEKFGGREVEGDELLTFLERGLEVKLPAFSGKIVKIEA